MNEAPGLCYTVKGIHHLSLNAYMNIVNVRSQMTANFEATLQQTILRLKYG